FSSRRRHTRLVSDWSSDVCSSDLGLPQCFCWVGCRGGAAAPAPHLGRFGGARVPSGCPLRTSIAKSVWLTTSRDLRIRGSTMLRSEERRVGKECRARV